ncbi:Bifunctional aspartokinase/homoserine dehydrogenase 1 [Buchnera aphidicola (Sipha maydis)]|uniref:bifunctional aspartate kinase/homoserine dehydrogenase I n=1 Tax=Buchnera aphidicola TaxID=9 RepID=UPI003464AD63
MINVLKFGGTSLSNSKNILLVSKIIIKKFKKKKIAVVLSAPANITNILEKSIELAIQKKNYKKEIQKIHEKFYKIVEEISLTNENFLLKKVKYKINQEMKFLQKMLKSIYFLNKCPKKIFAIIVSKGEILSTKIMENILISKNYNTFIINPIKNLISNGDALDSYVNIHDSKKNIKKLNIVKKSIILMPGFIGGNYKKELVLLGRNGSDYSAAVLSACLKAKSCEIWTDVDGILTCDPKIVPNAKIISNISYNQIINLSNLGAKVLHPKTISPLKKLNIPCYVKNTFNESKRGTKIVKNSKQKKNKNYSSITYIKNICSFSIKSKNTKKINKVYKKILNKLKNQKIYFFSSIKTINQKYINLYIEKKYYKKIKYILKKKIFKQENYKKKIKTKKKLSIISLIHSKKSQKNKLSNHIQKFLNRYKIKIINVISNQSKNIISFIINSKNTNKTIKLLHKILLNKVKTIEIFLLGIGGIGKTLLKQISQEKRNLKKRNLALKIFLIANSKKILFNKKSIKIESWKKEFLNNGKTYPQQEELIKKISKIIKKNNYINPVIIDCTSSKAISKQYFNYIKNRYHVITSNKKFNTGNLKNYKKIRKLACKMNKKFLYETNVGGGLPIIQTIKNFVKTGDKISYFKGILSGSLSFIFGKLEEGMLFSEAIQQAHQKGFTEPDPREDLSGLDVARKLLIIAREIGHSLELQDIQIQKILPKKINKKNNVNEFFQEIKKFDEYFLNQIDSAKKNEKKIKFIGTINRNGICKIKLSKINKNDPLYNVKDGENALSFYSKYYQPIPLVIKGYGAGKEVTASGVFSDLLNTI